VSSQPQPQPIEFPELKKLLIQIQEDIIINRRLEIYEKLPYGARIRERGVLSIADELLKVIRPEIRALQGKPIDGEALDRIRLQQNADGSWLGKMGYLNYVTDDRANGFLRTYVGQCGIAYRGIYAQHVQSILRGEHNSLHLFILWIGNGHRAANFLRLWSFPGKDDSSKRDAGWHQIKTNILEATLTFHNEIMRDSKGPGYCSINHRWGKSEAS